jgi:hypothetical protein
MGEGRMSIEGDNPQVAVSLAGALLVLAVGGFIVVALVFALRAKRNGPSVEQR